MGNQHAQPAEHPVCPPTGTRHEVEATPPPEYRFDELAQGANEVLIVHGAERYRLRLTRHGKLLLNK